MQASFNRGVALGCLVLVVVAACTLVQAGAPKAAQGPRGKLAQIATAFEREPPTLVRRDCSGLVSTILAHAGVFVQGGSAQLWQAAEREGRINSGSEPRPGDLAFFDKTYDANRNGQVDDELTHVAMVIDVEADGTVVMMHYGGKGVQRLRMNLAQPGRYRSADKVLNSYLRAPNYGPKDGPRLAGQLWRGFASPPQPAGDGQK